MRKLFGIGAVFLGVVGVLAFAFAIGYGWWGALRTVDRLERGAVRLDRGLSEVDMQLARIEERANAIRTDLNAARGAAETIAAENPELPRIRAEIEKLVDRLMRAFDRAETLADSLQSVSAGLRAAADIVDQFRDDSNATLRARNAADKIKRAAEALTSLRGKVEGLRSVQALQLTGEIVTLARQAIASSDWLAEGLDTTRQEIAEMRERTADRQGQVVYWIYVVATASTLVGFWAGLGQICLADWGRRRLNLSNVDVAREVGAAGHRVNN